MSFIGAPSIARLEVERVAADLGLDTGNGLALGEDERTQGRRLIVFFVVTDVG
ncbi:hypothetical protein MASR2M78_09740 [Treponema sp.]